MSFKYRVFVAVAVVMGASVHAQEPAYWVHQIQSTPRTETCYWDVFGTLEIWDKPDPSSLYPPAQYGNDNCPRWREPNVDYRYINVRNGCIKDVELTFEKVCQTGPSVAGPWTITLAEMTHMDPPQLLQPMTLVQALANPDDGIGNDFPAIYQFGIKIASPNSTGVGPIPPDCGIHNAGVNAMFFYTNTAETEANEQCHGQFSWGWLPPQPGGGGGDTDGDGVNDEEDNCPDDANTDQADLDGDEIGDVCDDDADGDDESPPEDCNDLDPGIFTGAVEMCSDGIDNDCDGAVDFDDTNCDSDGDGVPDELDNCPEDLNPGQLDNDGDSIGDACDEDDDNDTYLDTVDNCPKTFQTDQADFDLDGAGDACDNDADGDSVDDGVDSCLQTAASDTVAGVPSKRLGKNRWADLDGDGVFDTSGKNPTGRNFTINDTAGCNCAQIIEHCGYGKGHTKFGCSNSVMDWWTGRHDRDGEDPYQCKPD